MKEMRVYLIDMDEVEDINNINALSNEEWIKLSEEQGNVYSLKGFENGINNEEIYLDNYFIRFISYPQEVIHIIKTVNDILCSVETFNVPNEGEKNRQEVVTQVEQYFGTTILNYYKEKNPNCEDDSDFLEGIETCVEDGMFIDDINSNYITTFQLTWGKIW